MIIQGVSDIRIRCRDENNQLIWSSLRAQNIKAEGEWRTILPKKYRLSYGGYWYELNSLELEMYLAWSPYPETGTPTNFQIIWKVPKEGKVPEDIYATLVKQDEDSPLLQNKIIKAGNSWSASFRPIYKYSSIPITATYRLKNSIDLSTSTLAKYTINTNSIVLPNLQIGAEIVAFGPKGGRNSVNISAYAGDLAYAEYNPPSVAQWEFLNSQSWLSLSVSGNFLNISVPENTDMAEREATVIVRHIQYPFITKPIQVTQSLNPGADIPKDAEWLLLQFNWLSTEGNDLDNKVEFIGLNNLDMTGKWMGFNKRITTPVDLYTWKKDNNSYTLVYTAGQSIMVNVCDYFWKDLNGEYIQVGYGAYTIPLLSSTPLLRWGGDRTNPTSDIKIPGETYIIDLRELKKNHRDEVTSDFSIKCESHWYGNSGTGKNIVLYTASFKGGFPKVEGFEWKIYTDTTYTTELQPISFQDFPGISVINDNIEGVAKYTYVADVKYLRGADWSDDTVQVITR